MSLWTNLNDACVVYSIIYILRQIIIVAKSFDEIL